MSFKIQVYALALVAVLATSHVEARKLAPHLQKQLISGHDKIKQSGKVSATLAKVVETLKAGKECSQEDLLVAVREVQSQGHLLRGAKPHPMNRMAPCC